MNSKQYIIEDNLERIKELLSDHTPLAQIAKELGVKYDTLLRYLKKLNIPYTTNPNRKGRPHYESRVSAMYYIENNIDISAPKLRKKLIEEGIKEEKCECCGLTEWIGKKIPLELHHINGNHYDNRLENLQVLCSNCHMIAHDYSNTKK